MPFWNHCAICGKRIEVGEPCIGIEKKNTELVGDSICFDCVNIENMHGLDKTVAITDLLARAEAAEARCETLEKMVKEYQDTIVPGYRERAEKAEREAKEAQREVTLCRNGWKKAEKERDAAVKQLHGHCPACKHYTPNHNEGPCEICKHEYYQYRDAKAEDNWEWRGQKEE